MKKIILSAVLILLAVTAFADGLVSKSNQSAQYIRMLSRNASTGLDAFFYNPAGLTMLENGTYISVNNQFLLGEKNLTSGYTYLNDPEYSAEIRQMVFPTVLAAYKTGDLALSLGFVQAGGGGRAGYDQGFASFEIPVSKAMFMIPNNTRTLHEVQGYDADISFSGNSVYQGIQFGAAYQASKELSIYGGLRILPAKNVYEGSISNVQLKVSGEMVSAPAWLNGTATDYNVLSVASLAIADLCSSTATSLQQYITQGAGSFTLAQIQNAGYISSAQSAQLVSRLTSLGFFYSPGCRHERKTSTSHLY